MAMVTPRYILSVCTVGVMLVACEPGARVDAPVGIAAVELSSEGSNSQVSGLGQQAAPTAWEDWANWVEQQHPVGDDQGHGPDIGSSEWAYALDRKLGISDHAGHGPDPGSAEWRVAVEKKLHDTR